MDRPRAAGPAAVSSRDPGPFWCALASLALAPARLATRFDLAQALHRIPEALDLRVDVGVSHGVLESLPENRGSGFESGNHEAGQHLAHRFRLLHAVAHRDDGRREDRRFRVQVPFAGGNLVTLG